MSCKLGLYTNKSPVSEIETWNYHEMSSVWFFICDTAL